MLSIITPVKNSEKWLEECIRSAVQQEFTNWEWIWVDDHSTDHSRYLLQKWAEKDPRIHLFSNPGQGIVPALQKALAESKGQFITRMDADDLMPDGRLQKLVQALQHSPRGTVVSGLLAYFPEQDLSPGYRSYQNWLNTVALAQSFWKNLYRECVIASPNWMMRKTDLEKAGGFSGLEYPEDYDLVFRWFQNGFSIRAVPEVTLYWREHPQRTSRNSPHYSQEAFFQLKVKRFVELSYRGKGVQIWGTGRKAKMAQSILEGFKIPVVVMGLSKHPQKLHYTALRNYKDPQLLIAVYPSEKEREELQLYLRSLGLQEGVDHWFL